MAVKDTRRLTETNLPGHLTFEKPPKGFSPLRATDAQLRENTGYRSGLILWRSR
jgi:hypothetical protein